jgi:hypothetical protein
MTSNTGITTTLLKYDTTTSISTKPKKEDGGSVQKMPKMPRNNHVITCKLYKNIALFTGDTYTYRGIFKRNSGEFNTKFRGYLVSLDCIQAIRAEIYPQVQGYLVYHENIDLPIQGQGGSGESVSQKGNASKPTTGVIDIDDDY